MIKHIYIIINYQMQQLFLGHTKFWNYLARHHTVITDNFKIQKENAPHD